MTASTSPRYHIRRATPDDLDALVAQCRDLAATHAEALAYFNTTRDSLALDMASGHVRMLVAEEEAEKTTIIGHVFFAYFMHGGDFVGDAGGHRAADYASLFVASEHRRRGLATALLTAANRLAHREADIADGSVLAQSTGDAGAARMTMYRRAGFENLTVRADQKLSGCGVRGYHFMELYPTSDEYLAAYGNSVVDDPEFLVEDQQRGGPLALGDVVSCRTIRVLRKPSTVNPSGPAESPAALAVLHYHLSFCPFDSRSVEISAILFDDAAMLRDGDQGNCRDGVFEVLRAVTQHLVARYGVKIWIEASAEVCAKIAPALERLCYRDISMLEDWNVLRLPRDGFERLRLRPLPDCITAAEAI